MLALAACTRPKQLIEFGWDEPDTGFLRRHIATMERTPFHGCVFHANYRTSAGETGNFAWKVWGRRTFSREELAAAVEDLRATRRRRFTRLFLRANMTPGNVDWFDDFTPVITNLRLAAEVAREGGARGLLLDTEAYEGPVFDYRRQANASTASWEEYAAQARRRGREAMEAMQSAFPDLEIFLTFGYGLPWWESGNGQRPLSECRNGLLAPFLDGLVEGARGARLIDGYEISYGFKTPAQFWAGYDAVRRGVVPIVRDPSRYRRVTSVGFGLWMDYDWRRHGWDPVAYDRNYFTPASFETSLRAAWATTNEYVWIYTEQPRWWREEGTPARLPPAYEEAIRRVVRR